MLLPLLLLVAPAPQAPPAYLDPAQVLVIYDTSEPDADGNGMGDSEQVALAYQAKRGVPGANMIALTCSPTGVSYGGASAWSNFYNEVVLPVQAHLNAAGQKSVINLLFCHGVPYRLSLSAAEGGVRSLDQAMATIFNLGATPTFPTQFGSSPYKETTPGYKTDLAHFRHKTSTQYQGQETYLVSRLDGPDVARCVDLIEGAHYGDLYVSPLPGHYGGRLYVDTRYSLYPTPSSLKYPNFHASYAGADRDIAWATQNVDSIGFPMFWENTATDQEIGEAGALFKDGSSGLLAPTALFYYGWYNYNKYQDVFDWLPGSAACDLNSNSLAGIEQTAPGTFLGESFAKGLTCGVGVIAEPYLTGHPYPETFAYYLLTGYSFAEASNVADPTTLWRSLYVGDPLYCPMRVGKVVAIDTSAPPVPGLALVGSSGTDQTWHLSIDTTGVDPDLIVAGGDFGLAPLLDQNIAPGKIYSMAQEVTLAGLGPGFYRATLEVLDPVGNATPAQEILFINDGLTAVATAAQADSVAPAPFADFRVELAVRVPGGVASLTSFSATVDAPGLGLVGFNLFALAGALPLTLHGNVATDETLSLELLVQGGLPSGTYDFHVTAVTAVGSSASSVGVIVP